MNLQRLHDLIHILLELKQLCRLRFFIRGRVDVWIWACPVTQDLLQNTKFTLGVQADSWPRSLLRRSSRLTHSSVRLQTSLWKIDMRNRARTASAAAAEREEEGKIRWKHFLLPRYWHQAGKRCFASCCRRENSSDSRSPNISKVLCCHWRAWMQTKKSSSVNLNTGWSHTESKRL